MISLKRKSDQATKNSFQFIYFSYFLSFIYSSPFLSLSLYSLLLFSGLTIPVYINTILSCIIRGRQWHIFRSKSYTTPLEDITLNPLLVFFHLYRYRWQIRLKWYNMQRRMRRKGDIPGEYNRLNENGEEIIYDAYISVCDEDRDWVVEVKLTLGFILLNIL